MPINGRSVMATRHEDSVEWRAFADRICQNEHVRLELCGRQGGKCAVCGMELGKRMVVHHVDYDHECDFSRQEVEWTRPGFECTPTASDAIRRGRAFLRTVSHDLGLYTATAIT